MTKQELFKKAKELEPLCQEVCRTLWNNPETGGKEKKSTDYLRELLQKEGFVIVNEEKLEHAFYAEYGSGRPVVAILGEYDALPGLSQKVCTEKAPVAEGEPGQGCGHNLLGSAAVTASVAVKRFLENEEISGTVRFYGCPEEELLSGKVKMIYYHMFDDCDLAISWHPMCANSVYDEGYLASASLRFSFKGKTSHAAFAPERGRSALDAVELMNVASNYLREHVIDQARIHYTTFSGGFSPNIVPDKAGSWYYARAPHMDQVRDIIRRLELNEKGAAMMTETQGSMEIDCGCCEMKCNHAFADLTYENLKQAGPPVYTKQEEEFAAGLQESLDQTVRKSEDKLYQTEGSPLFTGVTPRNAWETIVLTGSSDSGDVSQIMPMNMFTATCWPIGCAPHTWQTAASVGHTIGEKGAFYAAKVMAGTAYDLFTKPETAEKIIQEFKKNDDGSYRPMYEEK